MSSEVEVCVVGEVDRSPPGGEGLVLNHQGVVLSQRVDDGDIELTWVSFLTVCARIVHNHAILLHPARPQFLQLVKQDTTLEINQIVVKHLHFQYKLESLPWEYSSPYARFLKFGYSDFNCS